MEEQILEILNMSCEHFVAMPHKCKQRPAKEITIYFMEFTRWKDFSINVGTRVDLNDNPKMYYVIEDFDDIGYFNLDGLYQYWIVNVKNRNNKL